MENEPVTPGASTDNTPVADTPSTEPPVTTTPAPSDAKFEVADGGVMMVDGKKVVFDSDLIASKKSLQSANEKAQAVHNTAIESVQLELSNANQEVAKANAKVQELTDAQGVGAASTEEVARAKQEAETAKSGIEQANGRVLELRRANIILQSGGRVTEEQLKEKSLEQLDSFEEAFKALAGAGSGNGNYALGGGGGDAVPLTEMDRAAKVINSTPVRGVREPVAQQ